MLDDTKRDLETDIKIKVLYVQEACPIFILWTRLLGHLVDPDPHPDPHPGPDPD